MATNRIDAINERRAKRQQAPAPPAPMPDTPPTPSQVAGSQVDNAPAQITYENSGIVPTMTSGMDYRQGALHDMTEGEFERNKGQMNASDKEYWAIQAKENPLSTYANLQNYLASGETPAEQAKRERRDHLGQVFANLGNLIGNAANLYYTSQGAYPADLNAGAMAENERMRRIKDKRDALKARQDALLAQAKGDDIRNAYNLQLARDKARAQQAAKDREREDDMAKFRMKLDADARKAGDTLAETRRHNQAMEYRAAQDGQKIVDSVIGADNNIYTRNSRLSENEAMQIVHAYMDDDELKPYTTMKVSIDKMGSPVVNEEVDWMAAAADALQFGKIPPEELISRGFKLGGRREPEAGKYEKYRVGGASSGTDYNQYKRN